MPLLLLLLLLPILPSACYTPGDSFPSCLVANTTWEQSGVFQVTPNISSPEDCQQLCRATDTCTGVTWTTQHSGIQPLTCLLFSTLGEEVACNDCVSGGLSSCAPTLS